MTEREALDMIAQLFEEHPEKVSPNTLREEIPAWDSLGVLTLMSSLDRDFGIQLSDDEIQGMQRVGDVLQILRRNGLLAE